MNTSECEVKNSEEECRSGCKHSGNEIASSCIVDECGRYTVLECPSVNGCFALFGSCVDSFEYNRCRYSIDVDSCISRSECDIFKGNVCSEEVLYDANCTLLGQKVCLTTLSCVWENSDVGCVFFHTNIKEEDDKNGGNDSFPWIIILIGLIF
jgi:hypothetical protein